MRVAYVGHFGPEHSTENDIRKSLEAIGHEVVRIQENAPDIRGEIARASNPGLVLWTHTHGGTEWHRDGIEAVLTLGVPTVGIHLDLWRGLPRTRDIGVCPFWGCQYLFTADGGDPSFWVDRGVNHRWSPPAVLEDACYLADPDRAAHPHRIIFVGARGYHQEYPFRQRLLEWLPARYGDLYRLYEHSSGMRLHRLNVLYASADVVIGDSCFAGAMPRYWSDRLPETLGRGGRLVFPRIEGLPDDVPCRLFEPGNFSSLEDAVDDALAATPEAAYDERKAGVAWARGGHTYRHRVTAMLEAVGCS